MRHISPADKAILFADNILKTLTGGYRTTERENPALKVAEADLTAAEIKHAAGLMRINHCGEVCAQALYQGQALTARLPEVRTQMEQAAIEENDHLEWCASRLKELDSHQSLFNPLWYAGSFTIGAIAGAIGDKWSLGFVAETENQVVKHLDGHLAGLPETDHKSRAVLNQMREDEMHHAELAVEAGAADLPAGVKDIMRLMSKVMTSTVYYV